MNKRIRELAEQANLKLDDLPDEVFIPLEEFAELIVRECDQCVTEYWDKNEPWMNPRDLLIHFGIEGE